MWQERIGGATEKPGGLLLRVPPPTVMIVLTKVGVLQVLLEVVDDRAEVLGGLCCQRM